MNYRDRGSISFGGLRLQSLPKTFARACKIEKKRKFSHHCENFPHLNYIMNTQPNAKAMYTCHKVIKNFNMAKGRKKLPDNIKALRGTDQPCRMENKIATLPTQTLITLPKSGLKGTAKKIFAIVATELIYNNILDHLGVDLVIAYCREMALYHDMMKDLEKEGYTVKVATKTGFITQVNPKRKIAESALSAAKALAVEFGMTPSSRNRVAALLSGNAPKDDFADFEEVDVQ